MIEESPSGPQRRGRVSVVKNIDGNDALRETRRAVFLDRDGTLIRDTGYPRDPATVELLPGAAGALRTAHNVQMAVIVVTNQSGIARGLLTTDDYHAVHRRMNQLLGEFGAFVDAEYHCPHHPDFTGPCDCRKPGVLLFDRAIADLGIDAAASTFIGDRWRDIAPARHYGGRGVLVPTETTPPEEIERARAEALVAPTLQAAIEAAVANA